ncbi:MAG: FHA domain-containing protein [Pirellulaceae bacterium]
MRAALTVQSGPATGKVVWVEQGVMFRVGRLPQADMVVREDRALSGLHFAILCDSKRCRVRDLNSTNGTQINGISVNLVELVTGDTILAGNTQFKVKLEGAITDTVTDPNVYPELRRLQEEQSLQRDPMQAAVKPAVVPLDLEGSWESTDILPNNLAELAAARLAAAEEATSLEATERLEDADSPSTEDNSASTDEPKTPPVRRLDVVFMDKSGVRRVWLEPGKTLIFGRTQMADVTVAGDSLISQAHFALDCTETECRLRDLHSQNGVLLNQVPVPYARVYDGDSIFAGETSFHIAVSGGPKAPQQQARSWVFEDLARRKFATFQPRPLESKIVRFESASEEPTPLEFMRRLFRNRVFCVVIDPSRIGPLNHFPPHDQRQFLIDWLPEELIEATSPVVYVMDDLEQHLPFLREIWGRDGSLSMLPREEDNDPLESLRCLMRGPRPTDAEASVAATDVMTFYWPSILDKLAPKPAAPLAQRILKHCELLFVEGIGPADWRIYSGLDYAVKLRQFGYREVTANLGSETSIGVK